MTCVLTIQIRPFFKSQELNQTKLRCLSLQTKLVPMFARVSRGQRNGSLRPYSWFSIPEPLHFLPSSSSIVLTSLSGPVPDPLKKRTSWPESVSELYQPSDRRLSAKLVPIFADRRG
jgi:hypothetical protein